MPDAAPAGRPVAAPAPVGTAAPGRAAASPRRSSAAPWPTRGGRNGSSTCSSRTGSAAACSGAGATPAPARWSTLDVGAASIAAQVQGSRPRPYRRHRRAPRSRPTRSGTRDRRRRWPPRSASRPGCSPARCRPSSRPCSSDAGVALFPRAWRDLRDDVQLPGSREPVQAHRRRAVRLRRSARRRPVAAAPVAGPCPRRPARGVRRARSSEAGGEEIAPWWPFGPGRSRTSPPPASVPSDASAMELLPIGVGVLDRLDEIDLEVAGQPLRDVLRPAYEQLEAADLSAAPPSPPDDPGGRPTPPRPRPSTRARR